LIPKDEYKAIAAICRKSGIPKDKIDAVVKSVYETGGGGDVGCLWRRMGHQSPGPTADITRLDVLRRELNRIADERGVPLADIKAEFRAYGERYIEEQREINAMRDAADAAGMSRAEYMRLWLREALSGNRSGEA